jgi:TATA-box binding protein (TBP) (component of TFIID and TFIIIB)
MEKILEHNNFINISTHTIDATLESLVPLPGILFLEIFKDYVIGYEKKKDKAEKLKSMKASKEEFMNQISFAFPINDPNLKNKDINLKYFSNGRIVLTGCRSKNDAISTLDYFLDTIKTNYDKLKITSEIADEIKIMNIRISMINTDISINGLIQGKINKNIDLNLIKKLSETLTSDIIRPEHNQNEDYCQLDFPINVKKLNYIDPPEHKNYYVPIKIFQDQTIEIKVPKYRYIKLPKSKSKMKKKRSETVKLTINDDINSIIENMIQFLTDNKEKLNIDDQESIKMSDYYLPLIDYHFKSELKDLTINLYDMYLNLMEKNLGYCRYEPCTYHGLNHKYIFHEDCNAKIHDHTFLKSSKTKKNKLDNKCNCEQGTFLVFQSGHIIMIAKTYKQIQTLFDYMRQYLIDNKDLIIF